MSPNGVEIRLYCQIRHPENFVVMLGYKLAHPRTIVGMKKIFLIIIMASAFSFPIRKLWISSQLPQNSRLYSSTDNNPIADMIWGFPKKPWLRKIWMEKMNQLLQYNDPTIDNNAAIKAAIARKDMELVHLLFKEVRVKNLILHGRRYILEHIVDQDSPFEKACADGNSDHILPYLLLQDFSADSSKIIRGIEIASKAGQLNIVKLLINYVDPNAWNSNPENNPLILASAEGHYEIVEFLLKWFDPSCGDNLALFMAAFNDHLNVVDMLLKDHRVDPAANENSAFLIACYAGNVKIVDRLLEDARVVPTIMGLHDAYDGKHYDIVESICSRLGLDPYHPESWN